MTPQAVLEAAFIANPRRFKGSVQALDSRALPILPTAVWIN
jgi:hypothetical protein